MSNSRPPHPTSIIKWTPTLMAKLRQHWGVYSASIIAEMILTGEQRAALRDGGRNAIIGKAHRMGLAEAQERKS